HAEGGRHGEAARHRGDRAGGGGQQPPRARHVQGPRLRNHSPHDAQAAAESMTPIDLSAEELQQLLASGTKVYLLDVRLPWGHNLAKIREGPLVPLQEIMQRFDEIQPQPGELVVTYCHHGQRSRNAASFLRQKGFPEARSLAGGIDRWSLAIDPKVPRY